MKLEAIIEKMRVIFVSKEVFELRLTPLEKGFYGFVTIVLATVLGTILAFVLRKPIP